MTTRVAIVLLLCACPAQAQDTLTQKVMSAVRVALAPSLPFPDTDHSGVFPANGKTEPLWMVRQPEPGEQTFEVLANPLNEVNQLRAARAMAQIQKNVESAQRRAAAQYEHAVAEAKRTGRSQEVDGVTLSDEGIAGAKIDADSHVAIEVVFNQPAFKFEMLSGVQPAASAQAVVPGAVAVIALASNVYRDDQLGADGFAEAERLVFLGRVALPQVNRRAEHTYEVSAAATPSENAAVANLVLRFRGNEVLIADLLRKTDWNVLLELLK